MTRSTLTYDPELDLQLELYLPEVENPPLFIYMHGGGLCAGTRLDCRDGFEALANEGYAIASLDYRMFPTAKYPDFIVDCAKAIDFIISKSGYKFSKITVGGSSAGGYLSMMLLFDKSYLAKYGIDPFDFDGWLLDAGQPTAHFNVLAHQGLDSRLLRVDETAPLWYISKDFVPTRADGKLPKTFIVAASNDMTCRLEQLRLLEATMLHFKWQKNQLRFIYMNGYSHCEYVRKPEFFDMVREIME